MTEYSEGRFHAMAFIEDHGIRDADELITWLETFVDAEFKSAYIDGFRYSVNEYISNSLS